MRCLVDHYSVHFCNIIILGQSNFQIFKMHCFNGAIKSILWLPHTTQSATCSLVYAVPLLLVMLCQLQPVCRSLLSQSSALPTPPRFLLLTPFQSRLPSLVFFLSPLLPSLAIGISSLSHTKIK